MRHEVEFEHENNVGHVRTFIARGIWEDADPDSGFLHGFFAVDDICHRTPAYRPLKASLITEAMLDAASLELEE